MAIANSGQSAPDFQTQTLSKPTKPKPPESKIWKQKRKISLDAPCLSVSVREFEKTLAETQRHRELQDIQNKLPKSKPPESKIWKQKRKISLDAPCLSVSVREFEKTLAETQRHREL